MAPEFAALRDKTAKRADALLKTPAIVPDGAGDWARFRRITLPMLRHAILVAVIFRMLDAFRVFDLVYVLTGGGPGWATQLLSIYVYLTSFQYQQLGYGAAMAVTMLVILAVPVAIFVRRTLPQD